MRIDEFEIKDEYICCEKKDKIIDILKMIKEKKEEKKITYVIVVEDNKPIGIISFRDIVLKLMGKKTPLGDISANDVMTSPVMTVKNDKDAKEAQNLMIGMGLKSLPVVDDNENLVGCVTINDLVEKNN